MVESFTNTKWLYIITFHKIFNTKGADRDIYACDEGQLKGVLELAKRYQMLVLTFDDAHRTDIESVTPRLLDYGLRARFFIPTEFIGKNEHLSRQDIKTMSSLGMIIGSHGIKHVVLTGLTEKELVKELVDSKMHLEDLIGDYVEELALPYGKYNKKVLSEAYRAGYKRVFSSDGGWSKCGPLMARNTITQETPISILEENLEKRKRGVRHWGSIIKRLVKKMR